MKAASQTGDMSKTLGYTDEKVVSTDFRGCRLLVDLRRRSWYRIGRYLRQGRRLGNDNEYGYTCNMLRFVQHVAK